MKRSVGVYLIRVLLVLFGMGLFFFSSCGLETYYYLDPPNVEHEPIYSSSDQLQFYFSFRTKEDGDNNTDQGTFKFLGTYVYYKIYNSYSEMKTREDAVSTLNSSTNYTAAADRIISTYKYQVLGFSAGSYDPTIESSGSSRYVYIRLNDYGDEEAYKASICVGSELLSSYDSNYAVKLADGTVVVPKRTDGANVKHGFNFNSEDSSSDENPVPVSDDPDVYLSTSASSEGTWYVDMYAISVGQDESLSKSYSQVAFLGSVAIYESDYED